jgi:hypothetical protein
MGSITSIDAMLPWLDAPQWTPDETLQIGSPTVPENDKTDQLIKDYVKVYVWATYNETG